MHRLARIPVARGAVQQRRFFVSSVLLTRTWENESVVDLRKEAKNRGLTSKGNKANLILRIQEHDKTKVLDAIAPQPVQTRSVSAAAAAGIGGVVPGIPPTSQPVAPIPAVSMNINIPDISQPEPETPIQIPFVPDFWDSSLPYNLPTPEPILPKLLIVAGAETHPGGGPYHNLHDEYAITAGDAATTSPKLPGQGGIFDDMAEDIGIPTPKEIKNAFWKLFS